MENSIGCLSQSQQVLTIFCVVEQKTASTSVWGGKSGGGGVKTVSARIKEKEKNHWQRWLKEVHHQASVNLSKDKKMSIYSSTHPSISMYPCGAACVEVSFKGIQLGNKIPLSDIRPRTQAFKLGRGELHIISCSFRLFNHRRRKVLHNHNKIPEV